MITAIAGPNIYMARRKLAELTKKFVETNGQLALERFDGEELEAQTLIDAVQAVPFLANQKMVLVRELGTNKALAEQAEKIISSTAQTTELILYEPSIDKRTAYYKLLQKSPNVNLLEHADLDQTGLAKWLVSEAINESGEISHADAVYLIERIGQDQMMLASELNKLIIFAPKVTRQSINLLTEQTPQSKIFELLDAAFAGHKKKALELYADQRAQKVEPQQILAMLAWQLHVIALIKTGEGKTPAQIASLAGINPYVAQKSARLSQNISLPKLKELVNELSEIDVKGKSLSYNSDLALQNYILNM